MPLLSVTPMGNPVAALNGQLWSLADDLGVARAPEAFAHRDDPR